MCLYPKLIRNRKYVPNKKNGGTPPVIRDERVTWVPVGCGKCIECMKQKRRQWQVRLMEEIKYNKMAKFITLTFSEESLIVLESKIEYSTDNYIRNNELATYAMRKFLERWRKKYKKSVKHFFVTELGHKNTERIHMHGIIWTNVDDKTIENIWKYGHIWVGSFVNEKTINYISKYINKQDADHKNYKPKILCSAGIGNKYVESSNANKNKYKGSDTKETYVTRQGIVLNLPVYYRNKLYSEEERERLWLDKLDKEEKWVMGEKIDVSNGDEEYVACREYYRQINSKLGYGDDSVNWDEKQYKNTKKRIELRTRYLKELNKKNKNSENKKNKSKFEAEDLPNIDFNKFNNF